MKIQEVISNVGITEKNGKQHYIFAVSASLSAQVDNIQSQILKRRDQKKKMNAW